MKDRSIVSALERRLEETEAAVYRLRLYIAGSSPRSLRAVANLQRICKTYLDGRVELEVIDIFQQKGKATEANILGAPTLIKEMPPPLRRLLGDLSDERRVLLALDLEQLEDTE